MVRAARHFREWRLKNGRSVIDEMVRGAAYSAGSAAMGLLVVWLQHHI
ncbi:hypothetical protein ABZ930_16885 [Streptomyces sp. NPDC046716]